MFHNGVSDFGNGIVIGFVVCFVAFFFILKAIRERFKKKLIEEINLEIKKDNVISECLETFDQLHHAVLRHGWELVDWNTEASENVSSNRYYHVISVRLRKFFHIDLRSVLEREHENP